MTASADLPYLSAVDALSLFRSKALSPVELLEGLIERVEEIEPHINAVCDRRFDEARTEAKQAETRYAAGDARPLEGLPVSIKEEQPMAGRSLSFGSKVFVDDVAEYTHPAVERIQAAGGMVHVRTTTPEFSCAGFTHTDLWGITRNPWNLDFSPGGSSGGSGAALAAGYSPLATGSDIGGSIRIPASFNGVVGFKPPYGRVPSPPPFNLDQYCHDGPLARTVADCALLLNAIAGRHPVDVVSLPNPPVIPLEGTTVQGRRVALCLNLGDFPIASEVETNTRRVAAVLEEQGAAVTEVTLPWSRDEILHTALAHFDAIFGAYIRHESPDNVAMFMPYTRAFAERASEIETGFFDGLVKEGEFYLPLGQLLDEYDVLICPTMGTTGFMAGEDYVETSLLVAGVELEHYLQGALTLPFNIASRCPVLTVPSGFAGNGVPTGVQIVGRTYDDLTVFAFGYAIEAARLIGDRRPAIPT